VDVVELLAERGICVDARTVYDWGRVFTPPFIDAARTYRAAVCTRWRVDEAYLKLSGRWW
jgi:IS6 family transposase